MKLEREELVEQEYLFRVVGQRLPENIPLQEILAQVREEVLATTKLPMAIDFLLSELKHSGVVAPAMKRLTHYFTPFQAYLIEEAENERGRFDLRIAIAILQHEAAYRAEGATLPGVFLYQFESICRNRLRYDQGLKAIAEDPMFDQNWRDWINSLRRQVGMVEFGDLLYVRSEYYRIQQERRTSHSGLAPESDSLLNHAPVRTPLFGEKEGRIALANRRKDPLFLFSALQRHLGYPPAPRPKPVDESPKLLPQILTRLERLETRIKLLEDEQKGGIDITRFYQGPQPPRDLHT